jgi:hypothetical protein
MERFARRENIKRYRKLLREAKDEAGRRLIQKLLTEEEEKEVAARTPSPSTAPSHHVSSGTSATCPDDTLRSARGGEPDIERTSPKDRV